MNSPSWYCGYCMKDRGRRCTCVTEERPAAEAQRAREGKMTMENLGQLHMAVHAATGTELREAALALLEEVKRLRAEIEPLRAQAAANRRDLAFAAGLPLPGEEQQ